MANGKEMKAHNLIRRFCALDRLAKIVDSKRKEAREALVSDVKPENGEYIAPAADGFRFRVAVVTPERIASDFEIGQKLSEAGLKDLVIMVPVPAPGVKDRLKAREVEGLSRNQQDRFFKIDSPRLTVKECPVSVTEAEVGTILGETEKEVKAGRYINFGAEK